MSKTNSYRPTKLQVTSLGINISESTLQTNFCSPDQYMIIGEKYINTSNVYSMIVDYEGVAINTSLPKREDLKGKYALYVDGDVFTTGSVFASNISGYNLNPTDIAVALSNYLTSNVKFNNSNITINDSIFKIAKGEVDNVYYNGRITLGNEIAAQGNTHPINIVESADLTINHAQLSIKNLKASQLRAAIIGNASNSPVIINTPSAVPIEFHASRDQSYFKYAYSNVYYDKNGNLVSTITELPNYTSNLKWNAAAPPHMLIDKAGNIGINTSACIPINYNYIDHNASTDIYTEYNTTTTMNLHVDGPMYANKILIYDPVTNQPKNIERMFVKINGNPSYEASTIIPGTFLNGDFVFSGPLGVNGPRLLDENNNLYGLTVHGNTNINNGSLYVDSNVFINNNLVVSGTSEFRENVSIETSVDVYQDIHLYGGLFAPTLSNGEMVMGQVLFTVANATYSNLNPLGSGAFTPGKFGVGFDPTVDTMRSQLVVNKRDSNIYELELVDYTLPRVTRYAAIGHPYHNNITDGSVYFATGDQHYDPSQGDKPNKTTVNVPQNIYFFPGGVTNLNTISTLSPYTTIPTLSLYQGGRVGINTYPGHGDMTLHVEGNVFTSTDFYVNQDSAIYPLAHWLQVTQLTENSTKGIVYNVTDAKHVGINTGFDKDFGVVIAGGLKVDQYFDNNGNPVVFWNTNDYGNIYTNVSVGIGVTNPIGTLDIISSDSTKPTTLNLIPNGYFTNASLNFTNNAGGYSIYGPDSQQLTIKYQPLFSYTSNTALQVFYNSIKQLHQIVVGARSNVFSYSYNPDPNAIFTVDGNVCIIGDINITGSYKTNNTTVSINPDSVPNPVPSTNIDDVFIGGANVFLQTNGVIAMGYTALDNYPQLVTADSILKIKSIDGQYSLSLESLYNTQIRFKTISSTYSLGIENNNSFTLFESSIPNRIIKSLNASTYYNTAFNSIFDPHTLVHIQANNINGKTVEMLRLTYINQNDPIANTACEFDLHKWDQTNSRHYAWTLKGPNKSYQQKLGFLYTDVITLNSPDLNKNNATEIFTLTNNGCVGIGSTQPQYGLDIYGTSINQSIVRITTNDINQFGPQVLLQSGIGPFGNNATYDYSMTVTSNQFYIQQVHNGIPKTLLYVNSNNQISLLSDKIDYTQSVHIRGSLNITDGYYINNTPIIVSSDSGAVLNGNYIYLEPSVGVVVNNQNLATSNLFNIFTRSDNANAFIIESEEINEVQSHMRVRMEGSLRNPVYRTSMIDDTFSIKYISDVPTVKIDPSSSGYITALDIIPTGFNNEFFTNIYGGLQLKASDAAIYLAESDGTRGIKMQNFGNGNLKMDIGVQNGMTVSTYNGTYSSLSYPRALFDINGTSGLPSSNIFCAGSLMLNEPAMIINNAGNVGIGTTQPMYPLHIGNSNTYANQTFGDFITQIDGSMFIKGNLHIDGSYEVYGNPTTASDIRLKKDILQIENALEKIDKIHGYTFTLKANDERSTGLIAQEVKEILPEAVAERSDGHLGITYGNMMGLIVEAIRELKVEVGNIKNHLGMV